jgi:sulfur carrier protein
MGGSMIFIINGQQESIEKPVSLSALVAAKGLCPEKIVVEHNLSIIAREDWSKITIKDRDMVEIVSFVGGG